VWLLRGLYAANIIGAGLPGALITFAPASAVETMFWPPQDLTVLSILGSIWLAIGLASVLGLLRPLRLLGIFVVQLIYKTIWLVTFVVPALLNGTFRAEAFVMVGIFLFLIVGALLVVPFRLLVAAGAPDQQPGTRVAPLFGKETTL
jgi:hypothetical protein